MSDPATRIALKVIPGASRDGIVGWLGDALKVRVRQPAERGRANEAVSKLVADALAIPWADVSIVSGQTSQRKTLEIRGLSLAEIRERLS